MVNCKTGPLYPAVTVIGPLVAVFYYDNIKSFKKNIVINKCFIFIL